MTQVVLVIHLLLALALVAVILLQRSEGGGLGIGGGGSGGAGGMAGFLTGRGQANLLTRMTAVLAACFMLTSLVLVHLSGGGSRPRSILDDQPTGQPPAQSVPATPAAPAAPAPPRAQ